MKGPAALVCVFALIVACGGSGATAPDTVSTAAVTPAGAQGAGAAGASTPDAAPAATATAAPPTAPPQPAPFFPVSSYTEPPSSPPFSPAKLGTSERDVTYCIAAGVELKMDVHYPRGPGPFPVIVYIHGGRLIEGDKSGVQGALFVANGFVFVSINYRLAPQYTFPTMIEDSKCAIRHLRARAASYNINPNRMGAMGASSGGYLAALVGTVDAAAGFEGRGGFAGQSSRVQAVVDEYGHVDELIPAFSPAEKDSRDKAYGSNPGAEFLRRASATSYVSPDDPPFLILHGEADPLIDPAHSRALHAQLQAAGVESTLVIVKAGGHGWAAASVRLPGFSGPISPTLMEIGQMEVAFFSKHLKR